MTDSLYELVMGRASITDIFSLTKVGDTKFSDIFSAYHFTLNGEDYIINTTSLDKDQYEIFRINKKVTQIK